jgi:extracellular factor (EF) 3-hydroxypalmitic acid methyl ester biosynthesis protein
MSTIQLPPEFLKNVSDIVDLFRNPHPDEWVDYEDRYLEDSYLKLADLYAPLRDAAGAQSLLFSLEQKKAAKELVEREITPLVLAAPMARRAYRKPLGYAGDFMMMLHIYENELLGGTRQARVLHRLFCNHPLSQGVVTRKDFVASKLLAARPRRVTSIGCGPAVEVTEVSRFLPRTQWTLIDQDSEALEQAAGGGGNNVFCRKVDMRALVRGGATVHGDQDFIYCVGLYDYLKQETARALTGALFRALAPGGTLLIANAAGPKPHYFDPEFILDWPMVYRDSEAMMDLGGDFRFSALAMEPLGAYWFLTIQRT